MYYDIKSEAPDDSYPALVRYKPDQPRRSWLLGRRFNPPHAEPIKALATFKKKSVLTEIITASAPMMTLRLRDALIELGVSNIDFYPAEIRDEATEKKIFKDHVAFNVLSSIPKADLAKPNGPLVTRINEECTMLLVHETIKKGLHERGFKTLSFLSPDWMNELTSLVVPKPK